MVRTLTIASAAAIGLRIERRSAFGPRRAGGRPQAERGEPDPCDHGCRISLIWGIVRSNVASYRPRVVGQCTDSQALCTEARDGPARRHDTETQLRQSSADRRVELRHADSIKRQREETTTCSPSPSPL
jgi:hypothetical protein